MKKILTTGSCLLLFFFVAVGKQANVRLTLWKTDPPTLSVMWSSHKKLSEPKVSYRSAKSKLWKSQSAQIRRYPQSNLYFYESILFSLKPNTDYDYRIAEEKDIPPFHTFHTPALHPLSFHFTAYGDMGITRASHLMVKAILRENPDFHIHLGDIAYANGLQPIWDKWFRMITPLASKIFYQPVLGNHERERSGGRFIGYLTYLTRFALPPPETYYAFDYSTVSFIAINSDDFRNQQQLAWLKNKIKQAKKKGRWIVILQHHPPYNSSLHRGDVPQLIKTLAALYEKNHVDLVLTGHNHNYERTYPIQKSQPTTREKKRYKKGEGTIYIVSGGGGAYLRAFSRKIPRRTARRIKAHHYLSIDFNEKTGFAVKAVQVPGKKIIDAFTIAPKQ